jgi:hypothetical protein
MPTELFTDNAATTLTSSPALGATSFTVASSTGFPAAVAGVSQFRVIIGTEIITVTNVSGTTWTCVATAAAHTSADVVTHVLTAAALGNHVDGKIAAQAVTDSSTYGTLDVPLMVRQPWPLPQTGATFVTRFASGHGYRSVPQAGTINLNDTAVPGPFANQSVTLTNAVAGAAPFIDKLVTSFDLTAKSLLVWIKVEPGYDAGGWLTVYVGDNNLVNASYSGINLNRVESGWYCAEIPVAAFALSSGTPNVAAITFVRVQLNTTATASTVHVGAIAWKTPATAYPNGVLTFTFDDSNASDCLVAKTVLDSQGYAGVAHTIVDRVGLGGIYSSLANLKALQASGWEIATHAFTLAAHDARYTTLSADALQTEFRGMKAWQIANGFYSESWASPGGQWNQAVLDAMRPYYALHRTVGTAISGAAKKGSAPLTRPNLVESTTYDSSTANATITAQMDAAKANKTWMVLNLHGSTTGASSGATIGAADLLVLVNYAASIGIAVKTFTQALNNA